MPLYEYRCENCNQQFEKLRTISQVNDEETCIKCGGRARRLVSVVNHTFGWRLTDRCHETGGPREEWEKNV